MSELSRQLSSQEGMLSPFCVLRKIVDLYSQNAVAHTLSDTYDFITLQGSTVHHPKVSIFPWEIMMQCNGATLSERTPVMNALMLWSKMKFHVSTCVTMNTRLKDQVLAFIRDIELTLRNGALHHFGRQTRVVTSMTFDEFCQFALLCCQPGAGAAICT